MEDKNHNNTIIIDNGSSMCKAGMEQLPNAHFPAIVGRP